MEIWQRIESSVEFLALEKAVKKVMETAEECQQDRRQVVLAILSVLQETSTRPATLLHKLEILMNLVWERLNTGHWAKVIASPLGRNTHWVWPGWRKLYALLAVARVRAIAQLVLVNGHGGRVLLRDVVKLCDLGLLMGVPVLDGLLEQLAQRVTEHLAEEQAMEPPIKMARLQSVSPSAGGVTQFNLSLPQPLVPVASIACPSLPEFLTSCYLPQVPHLLTGCISSWPAMEEGPCRWNTDRLVRLAGPRTVPVELGAKYTDHSWTQKLMTIDDFVEKHMMSSEGPVGYLAQHQLLEQVPALMEDIEIPDYCYTGDQEDVDVNVWIGPRGTVSPPHTDPKHNILCQVTGTKFVALFLPSETPNLYPSNMPMMENTSTVDLDVPDLDKFPKLKELKGFSAIIGPGDSLYIPKGVWHYVRSLEESFSVSFWWL